MNRSTYDQLKKNPHYKMSEQQRIQALSFDGSNMVEFGSVPTHNHSFDIHQSQKKPKKHLEVQQ